MSVNINGNSGRVTIDRDTCLVTVTGGGPQGLRGEKGETGSTLGEVDWQGAWSDATTYSAGQGVTSTGRAYVSLQKANLNHAVTDGSWWAEVSSPNFGGGFDVIVYQRDGLTIAEDGWTHELIDSGVTGPMVNTRVLNAAYDACPVDGSLYIGRGTYYVYASTVCTAGPAGYLTYHVALPVSKNIHIRGAGMGATVLMLAAGQHYTNHPALIMYVHHPYSDGGYGTAYTSFSLEDMTFDGNVTGQTVWHYDGAGLLLTGSIRSGGVYRNLEFRNSADSGVYWGYNGAGFETNAFMTNIYSHDNADFDQFDNFENCILNGYVGDNNGNAYNHIGLIIDSTSTGNRSLTASNISLKDCSLFLFGSSGAEPNPDASIQISNLNIDCEDTACNCITITDYGSVNIVGGRIKAKSDSNYGIYLSHSSDIEVSNLFISGLRGITSTTGTVNAINVRGCTIRTTSHCMYPRTGDAYNFYACELWTDGNAAYLAEAISGVTLGLFGCVGGSNGYGVILGGGTIKHSGTVDLGLEASGSASVADGGTIEHGLKITPRFVTVQASLEGTTATPASIGASTFAVNFSGVTTTQTVYWHAKY